MRFLLHAQGFEQCLQPARIIAPKIDMVKGAQLEGDLAITIENRDDRLMLLKSKGDLSSTFVEVTEEGDRITSKR